MVFHSSLTFARLTYYLNIFVCLVAGKTAATDRTEIEIESCVRASFIAVVIACEL